MGATAWQVQGKYYENCSCDLVCPCVPGQMMVKPTQGSCPFAMAFQIERGRFGDLPLGGLGFVVVAVTPEEMAKGNRSEGAPWADAGGRNNAQHAPFAWRNA